MSWDFTPFALALLSGALASALVAVACWRRRSMPGGKSLFLVMLAVTEWALATALEAAAVGQPAKVLISKFQYLGILSTPVLLFLFVADFAHFRTRFSKARFLLWVVPLAVVLLAATNEYHHLIWSGFSPSPIPGSNLIVYHHGRLFYLSVVYSYILLVATVVLLVRSVIRYRHIYRRQALIFLAALPWPWLGNFLYVTDAYNLPGMDFTPLGFVIAGVFLLWGILRFQIIKIVPVAQEKVVESMSDALVVMDPERRIVGMNPAALGLLESIGAVNSGRPVSPLLGRDAAETVSIWPELARKFQAPAEGQTELVLEADADRRVYDLRLSPMSSRRGRISGWVAVLRDVTPLKNAEVEAVRARAVAEALREAGMALGSTLEFNKVTELILEQIGKVISFDFAAFFLREGDSIIVKAVLGHPDPGAVIGKQCGIDEKKLCALAVKEKRPIILDNITDKDLTVIRAPRGTVRSFLGVPVILQGRAFGLIALFSLKPGHFKPADSRVAESFAGQAALAVENSRLFEKTERQATTDGLTGILNRAHFYRQAEREFGRARRYRRPLAAVLFDIDQFKNVNDTYGHLIGDQVLKSLAESVQKSIRFHDLFCRFGGEEFLLLMPETSSSCARSLAERLRQQISALVLTTDRGNLSVTVSLGVATLGEGQDETLEKLIKAADDAMYAAKSAGRNAVRG